MIEKMKMVYVVSSVSKKDEMLDGLRDLGLLHLAEKKSPARAASERFTTLSKTAGVLLDYAPEKNPRGKKKLRFFQTNSLKRCIRACLQH